MPNLPVKGLKRPWITTNIQPGQRQTKSDNLFYRTPAWKNIRKHILSHEPLCRECKRNGRVKAASVVDHIIPIKRGGDKFDINNLQPLCEQCHASKSGKEAH